MKKPSIDLIKYRWIWFGISLAILIPGIVGIIMCCVQFHAPLRLGIDFTGGSILQYQFDKPVELDSIRSILEHDGFQGCPGSASGNPWSDCRRYAHKSYGR